MANFFWWSNKKKKEPLQLADVSWTPANPTNYTVIMNPYPKAYSASASSGSDWWHTTNKVEWLDDELMPKMSGAYAKKMADAHKKQLENQLFFGKKPIIWEQGSKVMTSEYANALNNGTA